MHTLDMVAKTVCKPGDKMIILDKEHGGHASVKPVVERLGVKTYSAPYNIDEYDLDYDALNGYGQERRNKIHFISTIRILLSQLEIEKIDTTDCVLLWDASQLLGLIAAGLAQNPLKKYEKCNYVWRNA